MALLNIDFYQWSLAVDLLLRVVVVVWGAAVLSIVLLRLTKRGNY